MKKRWMVFLLAVSTTMVLGACGNNSTQSSSPNVSTEQTQEQVDNQSEVQEGDNATTDNATTENAEITMETLRNHPETPAEDFVLSPEGDGWRLMEYLGSDEIVVLPNEIDGKEIICIGNSIFGKNSTVVAIKLSDSVEEISGSFMQNTNLKYVICGSSLKKIGINTFADCKSLEQIELNEGLEEICTNAFMSCESLTTLRIPNSVTTMDSGAYYGMHENFKVIGTPGGVVEEAVTKKGYIFEAAE